MSAASDLRDRAEALLASEPTRDRAVCTDTTSQPGTVAIGFALRGVGACVFTVSAAEWNADWRKNLGILDVPV